MSKFLYVFFILATIGLLDASYLTYEHYMHVLPPCSLHTLLADCGTVLLSKYATVLGIPVALFGAAYYAAVLVSGILLVLHKHRLLKTALLTLAIVGALISASFILLQLFVLHAICVYCMTSDTISIVLCGLIWYMHRGNHFSLDQI